MVGYDRPVFVEDMVRHAAECSVWMFGSWPSRWRRSTTRASTTTGRSPVCHGHRHRQADARGSRSSGSPTGAFDTRGRHLHPSKDDSRCPVPFAFGGSPGYVRPPGCEPGWSGSPPTSVPTTPAIDLYAGEHWDVARRLANLSDADTSVELWVCSAGYGLIPASAPSAPYAATFTPGNADSVPDGAEGASAWWNALASWEGPLPQSPLDYRSRRRGPREPSPPRPVRHLPAGLPAMTSPAALKDPQRSGQAQHDLGRHEGRATNSPTSSARRCPPAGRVRRHPPGAQRARRRTSPDRRVDRPRRHGRGARQDCWSTSRPFPATSARLPRTPKSARSFATA